MLAALQLDAANGGVLESKLSLFDSGSRIWLSVRTHRVGQQSLLARLQLDASRGGVQRRKQRVLRQHRLRARQAVQQRRLPAKQRL